MEDEDSVHSVQDLLNRFRGGGEATDNKKREYQRSQSDSTDSPKTPRKDDPFQALSGKEDLVTIIRSAATDTHEDATEQREYQDSVITAPLVKQFDPHQSDEPACPRAKRDDVRREVPNTLSSPKHDLSPKPPLAGFDSDLDLDLDDSPGSKVKDRTAESLEWRSLESDESDDEASQSDSEDDNDDDDDDDDQNDDDTDDEDVQDDEFEQASESDEKRPRESQSEASDHVFTMTTEEEEEPMSEKEQLADWEEEKESQQEQEEEEEEDDGSDDVIGDLETVSTEIDKIKTKERASTSSLDAADLDFSVIETSSPLNHDASRQKVILRQKGSLAKRRKPTRSSIRATGTEHDLYGDSTEPRRHPIPSNMMNGHDEANVKSRSHKPSTDSSDEEDERVEQDRSGYQPGPALRTGKAIGGVKTPILLPGLGDAANRQKLRSRPPVPPPSIPTTQPPADTTPAWLLEARQRSASKQAAPPKGEVEKLKQETEPEKPPWMKESMARRKRLIEPPKYGRPEPAKEPQTTSEVASPAAAAPWRREQNLQRSNRPAPLKASHSALSNSDRPHTETVQVQDCDMITDNKDMLIDLESPRTKTGRKVLSPIRRTAPPMEDTEQDENTPPCGQERNENTMFPSDELPQKTTLPPLKSSPSPQSSHKDLGSEPEDSPQPSWMAEVAARRKSKNYIHAVRPEMPIKLGETPKWKLDLAEKKKLRRESQPEIVIPPKAEESPSTSSPAVPPWKQELDKRKKRASLGGPRVLEPLSTEKSTTEEVPEWTRLVQKRRSRLANSGLIRKDQEDVSQ